MYFISIKFYHISLYHIFDVFFCSCNFEINKVQVLTFFTQYYWYTIYIQYPVFLEKLIFLNLCTSVLFHV